MTPKPCPIEVDFSEEDNCISDLLEDYARQYSFMEKALKFYKEWLTTDILTFYTSGSTGDSKMLMVKKELVLASVNTTAKYFNLKPKDRVFICLNLEYTGGKMMIARAITLGLKAVFTEPSNSPNLVNDSQKFALASFVPSQLFTLTNQIIVSQLSIFKNILIGGAAIPTEIEKQLTGIQDCNVYETFGMTETLSHIALRKINTCNSDRFKVLPGIKIEVNEHSCLKINAPVTSNEWIQTKDVVEIIDESTFKWKGRIDNMINSGGVKIYPEEIESIINKILIEYGIKYFYVTSEPDPIFGQKLILVIEGKEVEKNILTLIKNHLPKYKSPSKVVYVSEIKKTNSGKIIRSM